MKNVFGFFRRESPSYEFSKVKFEVEEMMKDGSTEREARSKIGPKYGFTPDALRRRLSRSKHMMGDEGKIKKSKRKPNKKGKPILSTVQETALVILIKSAALTNHALSRADIMDYVQRKFKKNDSNWAKHNWMRSFLKRHKKILKLKPLKIIALGRGREDSIE